jgi:uncharacterized protein
MSFWEEKPPHALGIDEWEQLCDGCGRCCMHKFEDTDSGEMLYTSVACRLFDDASCRCRHYDERLLNVPDCLNLRGFTSEQMHWLPPSCAYRLRAEGRALPAWHPLVSGSPESVHGAGISMRGRSTPEGMVPESLWPRYIIALVGDADA